MTAITEDAAGNLTLTKWNECRATVAVAKALPKQAARASAAVR